MSNSVKKSKQTAILGIFTAITVILQFLSYFVKVGTFSITLTLIPIILAAVMYGPKYSTVLGFSFGVVTVIGCITGIDAGGQILFNASPLLTIVLCMAKAILTGFVSGIVAQTLKKKNVLLSVIVTAFISPIVNTGSFILIALLFFKKIIYEWAGGTNLVTYIIVGLTGINFIIEMLVNMILSPIILRVIKALKRYK